MPSNKPTPTKRRPALHPSASALALLCGDEDELFCDRCSRPMKCAGPLGKMLLLDQGSELKAYCEDCIQGVSPDHELRRVLLGKAITVDPKDSHRLHITAHQEQLRKHQENPTHSRVVSLALANHIIEHKNARNARASTIEAALAP